MKPDRLTVRFIVDCTQPLEEMVVAGNYDWINEFVATGLFRIKNSRASEWEFRLFHFNRFMLSEQAIKAIKDNNKKNPWKPATIEHLLAYGKNKPDEQRKGEIAALGSTSKIGANTPSRVSPYLGVKEGYQRCLSFKFWYSGWGVHTRFLAVRRCQTES